MCWSKICRILNLIGCIAGSIIWLAVPAYLYIIGQPNDDRLFYYGMSTYWLFRATWEIGTVKRIRGQISDKTLIGIQ
jgi:hypothetical protein